MRGLNLNRPERNQLMAKTPTSHSRYRKDLSEMPDWMKQKACPKPATSTCRASGAAKNLTGKEKLCDIVR